jgi:hypothetical protein
MTPDFIHGGQHLIESMGYNIQKDPETKHISWYDSEGQPIHCIIQAEDQHKKLSRKIPMIIGQADDRAVRMVQEVQAHNDELKTKKAKENTDATKKHLHE